MSSGCTACGHWSGHDPDCPLAPDTEELTVIGVEIDDRSRAILHELDDDR